MAKLPAQTRCEASRAFCFNVNNREDSHMPKAGQSVNYNKRKKREQLMEYLRAQGLCRAVVEACDRLGDLDRDLSDSDIKRLKSANDGRLALIRKYLPDAKAIEISNAEGEEFKVDNKFVIEVVSAESSDTGEASTATETKEV